MIVIFFGNIRPRPTTSPTTEPPIPTQPPPALPRPKSRGPICDLSHQLIPADSAATAAESRRGLPCATAQAHVTRNPTQLLSSPPAVPDPGLPSPQAVLGVANRPPRDSSNALPRTPTLSPRNRPCC